MLLQFHVPGSTIGKAEDPHFHQAHFHQAHVCTAHSQSWPLSSDLQSFTPTQTAPAASWFFPLPQAHRPSGLWSSAAAGTRPCSLQVLVSQAPTIHSSCWHTPCDVHMQTHEIEFLIQGKSWKGVSKGVQITVVRYKAWAERRKKLFNHHHSFSSPYYSFHAHFPSQIT